MASGSLNTKRPEICITMAGPTITNRLLAVMARAERWGGTSSRMWAYMSWPGEELRPNKKNRP